MSNSPTARCQRSFSWRILAVADNAVQVLVGGVTLFDFEVFLAVLEVDAAEGGGDLGAEVAAVEGEDTRVVDARMLGLHVVDAYGADDDSIPVKVFGAARYVVAIG